MEDTGGDDEEAEEDDLHKLLCLEVSHRYAVVIRA